MLLTMLECLLHHTVQAKETHNGNSEGFNPSNNYSNLDEVPAWLRSADAQRSSAIAS